MHSLLWWAGEFTALWFAACGPQSAGTAAARVRVTAAKSRGALIAQPLGKVSSPSHISNM